MTDDELKRLFDAMRQDNAAAHEETRRYFDVTAESLRTEIRVVGEAVAQVDEKLHREVKRLEEKIDGGFADTQAMIKFSHAELDRRLRTLEDSQHTLEESLAELQARVERLETSTH